jgi:sporulation protein YlmC with PRC-barrel domain
MTHLNTLLAMGALALGAVAVPLSAGAIEFVAKQQAGEWLTHRLAGTKVLNAQGEEIGDVKDVVLDAKGSATTVLIGVGGFLGIPEKIVGVPYGAIHVGDVVQSSRVVILDATKDQLKAATAYGSTDPAMADRVTQKASDWAAAAKAKIVEYTKLATEKAKQMSAPKADAPKADVPKADAPKVEAPKAAPAPGSAY